MHTQATQLLVISLQYYRTCYHHNSRIPPPPTTRQLACIDAAYTSHSWLAPHFGITYEFMLAAETDLTVGPKTPPQRITVAS